MTEHTLRDEIDGAISKLCSISCQNEKAIKIARDTLKRISARVKDGVSDYDPLVERVIERLMSERKGDDWFMKHRLLETLPTFVLPGDKYAIVNVASKLSSENWMIRSAATEALGFLMTRDDAALPQCASKPGTRSNSRPPSPGRQVMRPANVPVKPRPEHGLVIDDQYGMDAPVYVPKREKTPATTVYDDGTIPDIDENNDEDAKTSVSRGSRRTALSDRSGASSRARSTLSQRTSHSQRAGGEKHIEQSTSAGALIGRKGGGGGSLDGLEAVQEESRIGTAVSEATRKGMGTAETHLLEDAAALLECEQNDEDDDDFQVDWDDVMEELVPVIREAFNSEEPEIRRNALLALRKSVRVGEHRAMPFIREGVHDADWMCREAALQVLRESTLPGDAESLEIVVELLEDDRRQVRDAALLTLETAAQPGDQDLLEKLITMKEYSRKWSEKTSRPAWEIRETAVRAIGVVADLECEDALEALKKSLDDDRVDVQRAATFAMGLVAERVVPEDMCWTYNNVTAQPAIKSTYLNLRWNVLRQAHVPNPAKAPLDSKLKHSPRELMQGLSHTPRGGALPHLMLTPRQEHLYEGEEFQEALALREEKRKDGDKKRAILAIAAKIKEAMDRHDVEEVERLQEELAQYEEEEEDEDEDDDSDDGGTRRSAKTKSLASFDDLGSPRSGMSEDTRSQISFSSSIGKGQKSAVSFSLKPTFSDP